MDTKRPLAASLSPKAETMYVRTLGSLAFSRGIPCVPGLDCELSAYMGSRRVGDQRSAPEMKAWIHGWAEANLAQRDASVS